MLYYICDVPYDEYKTSSFFFILYLQGNLYYCLLIKLIFEFLWCFYILLLVLTLRLLMSYICERLLACCDLGFESHRGHGYLSVVSVVCCQVEVSAMSWSLVQRSPTDWCVVCDLETSRMSAPYIYIYIWH